MKMKRRRNEEEEKIEETERDCVAHLECTTSVPSPESSFDL